MNRVAMASLLLLILVLIACARSDRPDVVGVWQERIGARRLWEFRPDGKAELRTEDGSFSAQGTWEWLDDGRLHYEIRGTTFSTRGTHSVSVKGDQLTLTEGEISVVLDRR